MLKIPCPQNPGIILKGEVNNSQTKFQLDSVSSFSFISAEKTKELNLYKNKETLNSPVYVITAKGERTIIENKILCNLKFEELSGEEIAEDLYILPGSLDNVLLGHTFLTKNEVQLDYREARIRINGRFIFTSKEEKIWS